MVIDPKIETSWKQALQAEFTKDYFVKLKKHLIQEKQAGNIIYPVGKDIFNAFKYTPYDQIKVVILGQDPYHGVGQAHGLSFSVPQGIKPPPSLKNIFKELASDLHIVNANGDLTKWAKQGVLLLNTVLTVRANQAHSHQGYGWEIFTDAVIKLLNQTKQNLVFLLWGNPAKVKINLLDSTKHYILTAAHPSPLSAYRGFFGCRHFSKTNQFLTTTGKAPIDWQILTRDSGIM